MLKDLEPYIPRSNWERYFSDILGCGEQFLSKRWDALYLLRCKVAHNAIMVEDDLERIKTLSGEVLPALRNAIDRLPDVTVPEAEIEGVAENAASTAGATVEDFILKWQELEATILGLLPPGSRYVPNGNELLNRGFLRQTLIGTYDRIRQLRNQLVHAHGIEVDESRIVAAIDEIDDIVDWIEDYSYVDRLRAMGVQERTELVGEMFDEAGFDILNSDEVCSAMAETNATEFDMDEILIGDITFDNDDNTCTVEFQFSAHGEYANDDRMFCGDTINGSGKAVISAGGELTFEEISADVEPWGLEEDDEFDPGDISPGDDEG